MKTKILFALTLLLFGVLTGCSNDNERETIPVPNTGDVTVRVSVVDTQDAITRAATGEQGALDNEKILSNVKVVVFDITKNQYETSESLTITNDKATATFKVSAGKKRFYVVSGPVTLPSGLNANVTMQVFETGLQSVTFESGTGIPSIAANPYAIGTLWGDVETDIPQGTVTNNVVDVTLQVGRMSTKIKLQAVNFAAGQDDTVLEGTFDTANATYRIGAVPTSFYLVGQYNGTNNPVSNTGVEVISAVHNESWEDPNNSGQWNPAFKSNAIFPYKDVNTTAVDESDFFYAVENTTNGFVSGNNNLLYGNTTFVQVKIKYTPSAAELRDAQDPTQEGTPFAGGFDSGGSTSRPAGTFWSTLKDGKPILFNNVPEVGKFDDGAPVYCYEGGINYYKFPVYDPNETLAVAKYRVLRNHYYLMSVKNIKNLGSDVETVDPKEPIPQDFDVQLEIKVISWSTVTNNDIIIE